MTATPTTCSRRPGRRSGTTPTCCSAGWSPERLIAVGESQSAGRLVTYINAVHPLVDVYDGFLVHSRSAGGAALSQAPLAAVPTPAPSLIRDDLDVPVLVFQTENDAGGLQARQADSPLLPALGGRRHRPLRPLRPAAGCDRHGRPRNRSRSGSTRCCTRRTSRTRTSPATCRSTAGRRPSCCARRSRASTTGSPTARRPPRRPVSRRSASSPSSTRWTRTATCAAGSARRPSTPRSPSSADSGTAVPSSAALRHHRALHGGATRRAVPQPRRFRLGVEPRDPGRGAGRVRPARGRQAPQGRRGAVQRPEVALPAAATGRSSTARTTCTLTRWPRHVRNRRAHMLVSVPRNLRPLGRGGSMRRRPTRGGGGGPSAPRGRGGLHRRSTSR